MILDFIYRICCAVASAFGDERIATKLRPYADLQNENVQAVTYRSRSIPIEGTHFLKSFFLLNINKLSYFHTWRVNVNGNQKIVQ